MSIPVLIEVYDEMRRLAIAGSAVAPGDFRLKKLIPPLEKSGEKVPVFAKVAQAVCHLDACHRLCLSGTPVENHLGELWSLMKFLMPGFLGGQEEFNRRFRNPIEKDGNEDCRLALKARVAPLILRRNKTEVAKEALRVLEGGHPRSPVNTPAARP